MLKMVDGTGIIGLDMVCPLGGAVSPPQPPNYDNVEMEGVGSLMLPNSLKAPLERLELLGNSVQGENPAPDNPQEIKSVGRESKNLFNIADLRVGQVQKDGTINEKQIYCRTVILDVPQDGKYRITFKINTDYNMLYFTDVYINGVYSNPYVRAYGGNSNSLISLKKGKNILSFSTYNNNTQVGFSKDHNIMIAAESETLDYEPYGYLLDVKVTGKNLIPDTVGFEVGSFNYNTGVNASLSDRGRLKEYIPIAPGKKYLVTVNSNTSIDDIGVHFLDINRFPVAGYGSARFISPLNAYYVRIRYKGWTENDKVSLQLQDTSLDYEPYTEQSLTLTSDRPITKWDKLVEQGGQYGWLYKHRIVNDLSALVKDSEPIYGKDGEKYFSVSLQGALFNYDYNKIYSVVGLCPKDSKIHYVPKPMIQSVVIYVSDTDTIMTAKEHMHYKVIYETTDSQFAPLSESEQTQLRNLHSYNGTTNITVDSGEVPCGIKLTYRKEI